MQNSTMIVLLAGLLVSGCDPWDSLPGQETVYLGGSLWSSDVVAADDGLYVSLDRSGKLVHVALDGTFQEVDLGGATPLELRLANDQHTMLAFLTWLSCEHPDEDISRASECPADDLKDEYSLGVVSGGDLTGEIPLPPDFNQVFFGPADTGRDPVAVVFMDPDADSVIEGVLSRNQVVFINLAEPSEPQYVSVGFQARNVLFTDDGARAVVFSQNQAAVVDVAAAFTVEVTFPFTLDSDVTVDPQSAVFTPDGTHILMAAVGRSDIYDFNLERRSINIIELDGVPTMMGVDPVADKTAVVYSSLPRVDIIEHAQFGVSTTGLDDPCNHVVESDDGFVLLYNDYSSTRDIYRVDAETGAVVEYVVPSPVTSVHLARDNSRAVAMLRPAAGSGGG